MCSLFIIKIKYQSAASFLGGQGEIITAVMTEGPDDVHKGSCNEMDYVHKNGICRTRNGNCQMKQNGMTVYKEPLELNM